MKTDLELSDLVGVSSDVLLGILVGLVGVVEGDLELLKSIDK